MPAARETRPRCDVRRVLWKTIPQAETEKPYVWFVREDGSNLSEVVDDARAVLLTTGMAWINEFSDLARILGLGRLGCPSRIDLIADLRAALRT
jgi:hypothetical protein